MGQEEVVLIDTSSWIEALRIDGRKEIRERVQSLLIKGVAAWCEMVVLELWNGARGEYERRKLAELEREITSLPITAEVWKIARALAMQCRQSGKTIPPSDLIITACALYHKVRIEYHDTHINYILKIYRQNKDNYIFDL